MRIAIVGSGISGLVTAWLLRHQHEVVVFERNDYAGGHTHTVDVSLDGASYAIDTGFIVFNDWTYPNFIRLLERLRVGSQPTSMSFSVRCERSAVEYNGTSLNKLFAQRRNLLRPTFHRMVRDILRFNREAPRLLDTQAGELLMGDYLHREGYSKQFIDHYLVPMSAAIWSAEPTDIHRFPARFLVRFFRNHGMLSVNDRPQWRSIRGGSREYVRALLRDLPGRVRTSCPVSRIQRANDEVRVRTAADAAERFDAVVLACHSDEALQLLEDPSEDEQRVLGAIRYQRNEVVLHTDTAVLPRRRRAWASWNYHIPREAQGGVAVTYWMNMLQCLRADPQFCVTLNHARAIDPARVLRRFTYSHPIYDPAAVTAQGLLPRISGTNRTYYCGAYWGSGFHEDGVNSALEVCRHFGAGLQ